MALYSDTNNLPKGLLLCNYKINQGAVTVESVNTFLEFCKYPLYPYSMNPRFTADFPYDVFDFIIIHDSVIPNLNGFIDHEVKARLKAYKGPIFQFLQDPYRRTEIMQDFMLEVGVTAVFTVYPEESARRIFHRVAHLPFFHFLTGYASQNLLLVKTIPLTTRKNFLGYRGRKYPYWFGETINLKVDLIKKLDVLLRKKGYKTDISTQEKARVYGRDWVLFIKNCRSVYATESDISYIDPTGEIANWYAALENLNKQTGKKWDGKTVLNSPFFQEKAISAPEGMNVIAPRIFEAICLRTALVLVEGEYSGVLKPWRHYIPLNKELSNINEVIEYLKDDEKVSLLIATAFAEIANNPEYTWQGYAKFLDRTFDVLLSDVCPRRPDELLTTEQLQRFSGDFIFIPNPHTVTVLNPFRPKSVYTMKRAIRYPWRSILKIYRQWFIGRTN